MLASPLLRYLWVDWYQACCLRFWQLLNPSVMSQGCDCCWIRLANTWKYSNSKRVAPNTVSKFQINLLWEVALDYMHSIPPESLATIVLRACQMKYSRTSQIFGCCPQVIISLDISLILHSELQHNNISSIAGDAISSLAPTIRSM